jgi:hypothetical protein
MAVKYAGIDLTLASTFTMKWPTGGQQNFQFPPKITSNSMSGDFKDASPKVIGIYPAFTYAGPNERYFSIETCYIVDGTIWDGAAVNAAVQSFRSYFFELKDSINAGKAGIRAKFWNIGGDNETTFFMRNLNIKHSSTYVGGETPFPLRTDVTFDLVLWWNFEPLGNGNKPADGLKDAEEDDPLLGSIKKSDVGTGSGSKSWY